MNVSLICGCFGSLGNLEAPQSLQALIVFPSLLCLPSSRVRTPAMFIDVVAATLFAGLLFVWSLLSGIAFWWCSLVLQFFLVSKARFEDQEVSCEVPPEKRVVFE